MEHCPGFVDGVFHLPGVTKEFLSQIKDLPVKAEDLFVATYPKSGFVDGVFHLPGVTKEFLSQIKDLPVKAEDLFVATYPKSESRANDTFDQWKRVIEGLS
ncbi:hypothetical protein AC249_AIPGENE28229 [Exaiptasia diaphana]|nr:hypothetical protein AC249_AIPGENE28229 [Exaiptasia diaphana]